MIVAHNLNALGTIRNLNSSNASLSGSLRNLSSGYKINTGSDDPSGLIISEQLRAQNAGLKRAVQNTQEAQNVLGIAEGALNEMNSILKKMKQLAVHSANNGVTSPEQIAADQAEVDSSVQTIDRIARTTKYSDQNLLNGNKAIQFDTSTEINSTADFSLLDTGLSEFYQIGSYGQQVTLSFSGSDENGDASMVNQASKAYLEMDGADNRLDLTTDSSGVTVLTKDQSFTIGGEKGSRYFSFAAGTALGEIVDTINSASESVGAEASLIFDSDQTVNMIAYTTTSVITPGVIQTDGGAPGTIPIFSATQGITGMGNVAVDNRDRVTTYTVRAIDVGDDQSTFQLRDNTGAVIATQTYNLPFGAGAGNGTQAVNLTSGNGTNITFDYHYGYGPINAGVNNHNVMTNTGVIAGSVATNSSQAVTGTISVSDANGPDTSMEIWAAATANPDEVEFTVIGDASGNVCTQVVNLAPLAFSGTGFQPINLVTAGGSNISFNYFYNNDTGANYEQPLGNLFGLTFGTVAFDRPDGNLLTFDKDGNLTNNNINTVGTYTGGVPTAAVTALPANATVNAADNVGTPWQVLSNRVGNTVTFTLRDTTGAVSATTNLNLTPHADIGIVTSPVSITTANGTTVSFNYNYESDNAKGTFDTIGDGVLATFNLNGVQTGVTGAFTNGEDALTVTSPSAPVDAAQNMTALIDIFDVVNGETPLTISAAAGAAVDEVVFTIHGSSTDPLLTQTVNLASFPYADTRSQAITLTTPNGSQIDFDYFYENDPTTNRFDRPVGDLFTVDATPVNSERLFNGLTSSAIADGASIDINLDPSTGSHLQNLEYGRNTDGQGRIFMKIVSHDTATQQLKFELYKNADYSPSALIGWGSGSSDGTTAIRISEANNSNIEGEITFDDNGGAVNFMSETSFGSRAYVGVGGVWGNNGVRYNSGFKSNLASEAGAYSLEETVFSGIELGKNTDNLGKIYFKTVQDGANSGQVMAYKDSRMRDEDLVAVSDASQTLTNDSELILNSANGSGLGIITRTGTVDWDGGNGTVHSGEIQFTQTGIRISASEYGSKQSLSITQNEGQCWKYYNSEGDAQILKAADGAVRLSGSDAVITINGQERTCDGLELDLATLDLSGHLVMKEGEVGATTVAQVGYSVGSVFTNAEFLTETDDGWTDTDGDGNRDTDEITTFKGASNLVNAGHDTSMHIGGFYGGMQLQLGEGSGGQERTVLGISSATALDIGKIRYGDEILTLNDLLSGGAGSLAKDPVLSMKIIDQAISDVSDLRARIGAWQSNLLQTNANSLNVAIENISKTESYIRDADMAYESTQFSKNQIMVQAGTSMLAQANSLQQNVLSLLG